MNFILLRDGTRVEPSKSSSKNPYKTSSKNPYKTIFTPEYLEKLRLTYKSTGMNEAQIDAIMSSIENSTKSFKDILNKTPNEPFEKDNLYNISDLNMPGKYEIIFRSLSSNNIYFKGDNEIRFEVSFNNFK